MWAIALTRLNELWEKLLVELCRGKWINTVRSLTESQVEKILSFQDQLILGENGKLQIKDKRKGGWNFDINKFWSNFFPSVK